MQMVGQEIDEAAGFLVDEFGNVYNTWNNTMMLQRTNRQGFVMVNLYYDGTIHTRSVALLVAKAYLPEPRNPAYNSVIHLNGDRNDCRAMNLMWRPRWFAIKYHKMFEEMPIRVKAYITNTGERFSSLRELCTTYGLIEMDAYVSMNNQEPCFHYGWLLERIEN